MARLFAVDGFAVLGGVFTRWCGIFLVRHSNSSVGCARRLPQHDRWWTLAQDQQQRRDALEGLLPAIADALDVRQVFPRLLSLVQNVIPHVTVSIALLTPDRGGVKIHVASNYSVSELPEYRFSTEEEVIGSNWRSFVAYDATVLDEGRVRLRISPAEDAQPTSVDVKRRWQVGRGAFRAGRPSMHGGRRSARWSRHRELSILNAHFLTGV